MKLRGYLLLFLLLRRVEPSDEELFDPELERIEPFPKLYKVIERNEDLTELGEGWQRLVDGSTLYKNEDFLEYLNTSVESLTDQTSEIVIRDLDIVQISGPTEVLKGTAISYNCELENLELIFPPAELALEIIDGKNASNQGIEVGGTFIPKSDDAPLFVKCYLRNSFSKKAFGVESDLIQTDVHNLRRLKLEGPSQVKDDEEPLYRCSLLSSSSKVGLKWKVNEKILDGDMRIEYDQDDGKIVTILSELLLKHENSDRVKLVCFVEGFALEYHRQKTVEVLGVNTTRSRDEIWQVVERDTIEEDFIVPDGFNLVDIDENNFRFYASKIRHLLTEEIEQKAMEKLVGFVSAEVGDVGCDDCCPDQIHPQHGPEGYGCCTYTEYGCCPDNVTPAEAPFFDVSRFIKTVETEGPYQGCECESSPHGCCDDQVSPALGAGGAGCGCQESPHGCCPDQQTPAEGPDNQGCHCSTFTFGCCPDGLTVARGPNMEGCSHCDNFQFGCCEDGLTPAGGPGMEGCGCEASRHGCCLDGSKASGTNLRGCPQLPGEVCHLPFQTGSCTNYTAMWFFNMTYGGCGRFWYGGCDAGQNHFLDEEGCKESCVQPRGAGVCFLSPMVGPCKGSYEEWYYDLSLGSCRPFTYGGCLGNANRFATEADCQSLCLPDHDTPVCLKPKAEGACGGDHRRWFYDKETGQCREFSYSGCLGNNNRFMSEVECLNTCQHQARTTRSLRVCNLYLEPGLCPPGGTLNKTLARWGFHTQMRRCVPFYYSGCGGNQNNFHTWEECDNLCPTTSGPSITITAGGQHFFKRNEESRISVTVRANPEPTVQWRHNGRNISQFDYQFAVTEDHSLVLKNPSDLLSGEYELMADNGIGKPTVARTVVTVYPIFPMITLSVEKSIFKPGTEAKISCKVKVYPPTEVQWTKKVLRAPETGLVTGGRISVDGRRVSVTEIVSTLLISDVKDTDTGEYSCSVGEERKSVAVNVQYGPGELCRDRPTFLQCSLVANYGLCSNKYYSQFCCRSCTEAGQIPGGSDSFRKIN